MKSFAVDLQALLTVAAAVLDPDGVLLEANAGFLRLLPIGDASPIGASAAEYFIQPTFATLAETPSAACGAEYAGLLTIGDRAATTRTLRGRVWRSDGRIQVLAEYDIAELERLNLAILDINRESSMSQRSLSSANLALQQREARIVEESLTDVLTGVGNRRKLELSLASEISRVQRHGGALSAIMTDIDHFKRVNDENGHAAGDRVLARFGEMLRERTRPTDIVARFGGEEFVILMPHTSLANAAVKAEQIRSAISSERIEPLAQPVTSSFGVAELAPGEDAASFIARFDAALYQAKNAGRNCVVQAGTDRGALSSRGETRSDVK